MSPHLVKRYIPHFVLAVAFAVTIGVSVSSGLELPTLFLLLSLEAAIAFAAFTLARNKWASRVEALTTIASEAGVARNRFLANVSHEIRNPLGIIAGFNDLIATSGKLDGPYREWAATVGRNANGLTILIDNILDYAKSENEQEDLVVVSFDLKTVAREVLETFREQSRTKNLLLEFSTDDGDFTIASDEERVRQVLKHVISNALKFTSKGVVGVRLEQSSEGTVLIRVKDTGVGIAEKDFDKLFQAFSQVGDQSRHQYGGTGMGLTLARSLAKSLRATLTLEGSKVGKGSEFALRLPKGAFSVGAVGVVSTSSSMPSDAPSFKNRSVLVVEDSMDQRTLVNSFLSPTGIEVVFAENGREALKHAWIRKFDLVIMDLQMPEMDGFQATVALREGGWQGPIVALTAHALQPERERAMKNGFDGYLTKPISRSKLWAAMQSYLV